MKFSEFLLEEEEQEQNQAVQVILKVIENHPQLPKPTSYLDSGQDAIVFNSTDPNLVIRVGKKDCE